MLEAQSLLICRDSEGPHREILDAESRRLLGSARWQPSYRLFWLRWLVARTLDVFEADDEPLVFSVRRVWALSSKWEVCDADGQSVAVVRRDCVADQQGLVWACLERNPRGMRFWRGDCEVACVRETSEGWFLTFAPELRGNPLLKMGLLGAVLVSRER